MKLEISNGVALCDHFIFIEACSIMIACHSDFNTFICKE
ncbi:MAG: hypothetical protein ACJAZ2_000186 [Glaciecola sp.]|jgi:hypothetical protein